MMPDSFLEHTRRLLEPLIKQALEQDRQVPPELAESIAYSCLDGGKRIRPALALASGQCCGIAAERVYPLMVAVELLHCFSLVHDDLPCMDDDDLRRGRPSTHKRYGESTGLLAGDALLVIAFEHLLRSPVLSAAEKASALGEFAGAIGASGMIGGQFLDMKYVGQKIDAGVLSDVHQRKTGALIRCCCLAPTLLLDGSEAEGYRGRLDIFGRKLGVGFQIVDDILDEISSSAKLGKPAGSDRERGHCTYTTALGLDGARAEAARCHDEARAALDGLGEPAAALRELADLVFGRISTGEI